MLEVGATVLDQLCLIHSSRRDVHHTGYCTDGPTAVCLDACALRLMLAGGNCSTMCCCQHPDQNDCNARFPRT